MRRSPISASAVVATALKCIGVGKGSNSYLLPSSPISVSRSYVSVNRGGRRMMDSGSDNVTRVLFCGPDFPASHVYTKEYVQPYPFIQVDDVPFVDVPDVIGKYDICVVKSMKLDSELISRAKRMKLIMQFGVGLEGVDISSASKHEVKVARIPGGATGNADSCAEMTIYLMLGLLRRQNEMQVAVQQKIVGVPTGDTLMGKTLVYIRICVHRRSLAHETVVMCVHGPLSTDVLILGFGSIGISLAKRLRPFGVKIIATKRSWALHSDNSCKAEEDDLVDQKGNHEDSYQLASQADIVVCCLRMNTETAGIVNEEFVSAMKKGAFLVNIGRGGLFDYKAVFNHLKAGHLGGLGIDVAWTEPFDPDDAILKFPNVIITPHVGGVTEPSYRYMAKVVGDVARQLHAGEPLTGIEIVN